MRAAPSEKLQGELSKSIVPPIGGLVHAQKAPAPWFAVRTAGSNPPSEVDCGMQLQGELGKSIVPPIGGLVYAQKAPTPWFVVRTAGSAPPSEVVLRCRADRPFDMPRWELNLRFVPSRGPCQKAPAQ